jgi:hypothetical protein
MMLCHNFLIGEGHTENHMCVGRIHVSQLREGANAGQHTYTLAPALTPLPQRRGLLQCLRACTMVPWYIHVHVDVRTYVLTYNHNISQKRLEIQALTQV